MLSYAGLVSRTPYPRVVLFHLYCRLFTACVVLWLTLLVWIPSLSLNNNVAILTNWEVLDSLLEPALEDFDEVSLRKKAASLQRMYSLCKGGRGCAAERRELLLFCVTFLYFSSYFFFIFYRAPSSLFCSISSTRILKVLVCPTLPSLPRRSCDKGQREECTSLGCAHPKAEANACEARAGCYSLSRHQVPPKHAGWISKPRKHSKRVSSSRRGCSRVKHSPLSY